MTSGVRDVIAGMYLAIDRDDFSALAELFQPHAIFERPASRPLVGRDAILHFYRHNRKIVSGRHEVKHIVVESDAVGAAWGSFAGRRVEGWMLELCFADGFTFEGGLIQTRRSHIYLALPA